MEFYSGAYNTLPPNANLDPQLQKALNFLGKVKRIFGVSENGVYHKFLEIMKGLQSEKIDTRVAIFHVQEIFKGYPSLIDEFNVFLPTNLKIECTASLTHNLIANSYTPVTPAPAEQNFNTLDPGFDVAKNFVKKIKARFKDRPEIYKSFLHILRTFEIEKKSISDVHKQVFGLFGDNEDLVKEFIEFLPDNTDLNVEKKAKIGSEGTHFELEMFFRIKLHLTKEGKYREFVHLMEMVNREILTKHQFSVLSHILFINNLEYWNWLNKFLDIPLDEINMDQDLIHPDLMEVDSESYVPERKTIFASGRGDKENLILNNNLISKISIQKLIVNANQDFEDKLVKWDLQIEWNNQAITTLTDIQNRLELLTQDEKERVTLDLTTLSVFHLKAIKSLYGERFEDIRKFLCKHPAIAIPIILKRLIQKKKEWERERYDDS